MIKKAVEKRRRPKREIAVRPSPPPAPPVHIVRIGGHLIDVGGWPEEVVERIRKDYLMPPAMERLFLVRVTLTATCPQRHGTQHNVGIMAATADMAHKIADGIPRSRTTVNCSECGKPAMVTGKHIYFAAPMAEWDGAL